jgi:hypothetical protein
MKNIFKLQKKHIAFFTIVPLLLTTAIIKVPCPVCEGKGTVSNTGMSTVRITDVESTIKDVYVMDTCLNYRIYNVDVKVTLQNDSLQRDARGFIILVLIDETTGKRLDDQIVVAEVAAQSRIETSYSIVFLTLIDDPMGARVDAGVLKGEVPDNVCGGTGKVSINSWPLYNATVERLVEVQRIAVNFQPRELTPSEIEELMGQEGNTDQWYEEHGDIVYN